MKHTSNNLPPANTLRGYMDTSRKRQLVDGWLAQAMALVQRFLRGEETNEGYFSRTSLLWARTICRMDKEIRDCENFNHNLRIRAYVLMTKSGKAWARGVLGETNIKRWQKAYDACRETGWLPEKKVKSAVKVKFASRTTPKSYNWKPIALPKMAGLFLKPIDFSFPELPDPFAKNLFAWPRETRVLTPAIFWPHTLEDDYVEDPDYIFCAEQPSYAPVVQTRGESSRSEAGKHNDPPEPSPSSKPP